MEKHLLCDVSDLVFFSTRATVLRVELICEYLKMLRAGDHPSRAEEVGKRIAFIGRQRTRIQLSCDFIQLDRIAIYSLPNFFPRVFSFLRINGIALQIRSLRALASVFFNIHFGN